MTTMTEGNYIGDLVLWEQDGRFSRAEVTLASGAGALKTGALLGRITTGGKYQLSAPGASDGSQAPAAVLLIDADATSADAPAVVLVRDARIRAQALTYHSTVDNAAKRATAQAALAALGIICVEDA